MGLFLGANWDWKAPFHLLDAVLRYATRQLTVDGYANSRVAARALGAIDAALDAGRAARVVQTTPHLVLLDKGFYLTKLRPPLARWALLWLRAHGPVSRRCVDTPVQ